MRDSGSGRDGKDIYGSGNGKWCVSGIREDVDGGVGVGGVGGGSNGVRSWTSWSGKCHGSVEPPVRLAVRDTSGHGGDLATAA